MSDNTQKTGGRGGKRSTSWKKGESGNPKGAPKRGESWAEIIDRIGAMTPIEAAAHANAIAGKLKTMGGAITLKEAVVIRGYAALLFEPSSSLMNIYMDRTDGKVKDRIDLTSNDKELNPYMSMDKAELIALAKKIAEAGGE